MKIKEIQTKENPLKSNQLYSIYDHSLDCENLRVQSIPVDFVNRTVILASQWISQAPMEPSVGRRHKNQFSFFGIHGDSALLKPLFPSRQPKFYQKFKTMAPRIDHALFCKVCGLWGRICERNT